MYMFVENVRMAFQSLMANKSRAFLTMLGIIIGISSVIAIMTVGNSMTSSVNGSMQSLGANNVTVYVTARQPETEQREDGIVFGKVSRKRAVTQADLITDDMIYSLVAAFPDEIAAISVEDSVGAFRYDEGAKGRSISVSGVSLGYFIGNEKKMLAGNTFSNDELKSARSVIVIGSKFVDNLWDGDYESAIGRTISGSINGTTVEYSVIGVYQEEESGGMFDMGVTDGFIPLTTAKNFSHTKNYSVISVVVKAGIDSEVMSNKIKNYLEGYYRSNQYFTVGAYSMAFMMETMNKLMSSIVTAISVIAGIALVVGGIGVMNIMLVSITERTKEIGTRKALGAPNSSIRMQFIIEAMIICLIGGVIGIVLGVAFGLIAAKLLGAAAVPSLSSIFISLFFSLAIGVFFGYYPANKAAKMNPIDALRYE